VAGYRVEYDPAAIDDLAGIRDHIAASGSPATASAFIIRVLDHLDGLGVAPKRGSLREDIRPGLRLVGWRRVLTIAFVVDDLNRRVIITAVLYRGRDVDRLLKQRKGK
jgi:plasmid stabilization system protein ParE